MGFYTKTAFRLFSQFSDGIAEYFGDVRLNLRKARMKLSVQEYVSVAVMTAFVVFLASFIILTAAMIVLAQPFLMSFLTSLTVSMALTAVTFISILNYPRITISEKAKHIENALPFAALYLATMASSRLPLYKVLNIFARFSEYGDLTREVKEINDEMEYFGADMNQALEHAIERSPSKSFKEMLWGMTSTIKSGGDATAYLREVSVNLIAEYRRKLYEFSHQLAIFIEIYLTVIVLGVMFFVILSSILTGISESSDTSGMVVLQFLLIFFFMPLISIMFIVMIKSSTPGEE